MSRKRLATGDVAIVLQPYPSTYKETDDQEGRMLAWLLALVFKDGKVDSQGKKAIIGLIIVTAFVAIAFAIFFAATGR